MLKFLPMIETIKKFHDKYRTRISERRIATRVGETGLNDFVRYLHSPWRIIWSNLLAGIFRGLGFIIGATVVLAITVYILVQVLGSLPIVGEFFQGVGSFVNDIQEGATTLKSLGR